MQDRLNNLKAHTAHIALTEDEKSAGREMLRQYMSLMPLRSNVPSLSRGGAFGFSNIMFASTAGVFGLVLAMALSVGGVSYAAESALPGDALYGMKVGVNEQVHAAMMTTEAGKAAWATERAERRLAEAEALIEKGALKTETGVQLDADFRQQVDIAQSSIAKIQDSGDDGAAVDVAAHLEGSLRAHKKIFAALLGRKDGGKQDSLPDGAASGGDVNGGDTSGESVASSVGVSGLTAAIDAGVDGAQKEGQKSQDHFSSGDSSLMKGSAQGRRVAAVNNIASVRAFLASKSSTLDQKSQADAGAQLSLADAAVASGDAKLAAGDSRGAMSAYASAQRIAQEAKMLARAVNQFKVNVQFGDDGGDRVGAGTSAGAGSGSTDIQSGASAQDGKRDGGRASDAQDSQESGRRHGGDDNVNGAGVKIDGQLHVGLPD